MFDIDNWTTLRDLAQIDSKRLVWFMRAVQGSVVDELG
jgi:hypothetical protein